MPTGKLLGAWQHEARGAGPLIADEDQQIELIAHVLRNAINDVEAARQSIAERNKIRGEK
jgi:hypothetical protein